MRAVRRLAQPAGLNVRALQPTPALSKREPGTAISTLAPVGAGVRVHADAQADMLSAEASSAICVQRFDDSRTVQVTLRFAFRCVLHRCESQDIRC